MKISQLAIIVPGLIISAAAIAAQPQQTLSNPAGFYAGAMAGWSHVKVNTNFGGFNYFGVDQSSADGTIGNVFVGYDFNEHFGAELGGMNFHNHTTANNIWAEYIALKGMAPIGQQLSVYGKVGVFGSNVPNERPGILLAGGADYNVTEHFAFGPEFIWMRQDTTRGTTFWNTMFDTDVEYSSVGLQATYKF